MARASSVLPYPLEPEALRRLPASVFGVLMSTVVVASAGAASISHREDQ